MKKVFLYVPKYVSCMHPLHDQNRFSDPVLHAITTYQEVYTYLLILLSAVVDNAWRYADWTAMKEGLAQAELVCPEHLFPKLQVYKGYVAICPVEEQHLSMVRVCVM